MATQCDAATAHSALFMVLPREVRDTILTAAFGGRTVHIQQYSLATPPAKAPSSRPGWARGGARQWLGDLLTMSKSKGKRREVPSARHGRRWYASVCDRHRRTDPQYDIVDDMPGEDDCLDEIEESQWDGTRPFNVPAELAIGAMGWLLTCRQAYNEGIKILYASNNFHIRSRDLRGFGGFIPQIPEAGLSSITSMELVLHSRFAVSAEIDVSANEADILEDTLSRITSLMPRLQRLYLGFCLSSCLLKDCKTYPRLKYECSKLQVGLMEAKVRELHQAGRSCELELGLPLYMFMQYENEAKKDPSGRTFKAGGPHWKSGMCGHVPVSWAPRYRFFCNVQDQRYDPGSENGVITGPDVGYWMSTSFNAMDEETMHYLRLRAIKGESVPV